MTKLTGRIVQAGDPGWDDARYGFNTAYDYDTSPPYQIVFCQDASDVANAVQYARENDLPFVPRCGRHNYQGYSSLIPGGIIIDVNDMESVRYDRDRSIAQVGAGLSALELTELLWDVGVSLPLATGPSVGVAGLTLGGGFGVTSRLHGLTCDHLEAVELVDAEGKIIRATTQEHPDLFWALCGGGGGNFGIVTEFTFRVHPVRLVSVFKITWPWSQFERVVDRWQNWATDEVDDGITSLLSLKTDKTITLLGQYTVAPNQTELLAKTNALLALMLEAAPPDSVSIAGLPFINAARMFFGVDMLHPTWAVREHSARQTFKSTSALAYDPFPAEAIRQLKQNLEKIPPVTVTPSQPSMVQLLSGGGAPSRKGAEETAAFHRKARFVVQYDGFWTATQDAKPITSWVHETRQALLPWTRGAYVNYADALLVDPLREYYGANLERLVKIKRQYDPKNVFRHPQSIPTSLGVPTASPAVSMSPLVGTAKPEPPCETAPIMTP